MASPTGNRRKRRSPGGKRSSAHHRTDCWTMQAARTCSRTTRSSRTSCFAIGATAYSSTWRRSRPESTRMNRPGCSTTTGRSKSLTLARDLADKDQKDRIIGSRTVLLPPKSAACKAACSPGIPAEEADDVADDWLAEDGEPNAAGDVVGQRRRRRTGMRLIRTEIDTNPDDEEDRNHPTESGDDEGRRSASSGDGTSDPNSRPTTTGSKTSIRSGPCRRRPHR